MSRNRIVAQEISDTERGMLNLAMLTIEIVLGGNVLAVVAEDSRGQFVFFRPGVEAKVAERMGDIDWTAARRLAEEHIT